MDPDEQAPQPLEPVIPPRGLISRSDSDGIGTLQVQPDPEEVGFATQDADEQLFILARRDIITNVGWIIQVALLIAVPIGLLVALGDLQLDIGQVIPASVQLMIVSIYFTAVSTYALLRLNDWYYNIFLVTNKRILKYEFNPLNRFKVSEAELHNIQDVSQSVIGVFPSLFDYGNILIQTAASRVKFKVEQIPRATWLRDILIDLSRLSRGNRGRRRDTS